MHVTELTTVEIDPPGKVESSVIWMHGLGADAHDFEPIVPHLDIPAELGLRFVFPNAPVQPVTINGGMAMRAWYDILGIDIPRQEDEKGLRASEAAIKRLIQRERQQGISAENIILAGFSQGGAMALQTGLRYPETLGGIMALSCYVPLTAMLENERHPDNGNTPIFMAHGTFDPVVPYSLGKTSMELLQSLDYAIEWHEYPMAHEVNLEEIQAIGQWLKQILQSRN
jgi:phospholipase/carboxylesterase